MDIAGFIQAVGFFPHLTAFLIGMPRLFTVALVAPFFGTGVLEGQIWFVLVLGLYLPVHPAVVAQLHEDLTLSVNMDPQLVFTLAAILTKEILLGLGLGFLAGLPFWAIEGAGGFIDNQRGAAQSEGTEILTGKSVSPMGGLLFQCLTYLFYTSGAFLAFLGLVYASYELWPVTSMLPEPRNWAIPLFFAGNVAWLMAFSILLSAPISVSCLLVDISLGLVNRFSPQLNAYILAMPIKSGLASVFLILYLSLFIYFSPEIFQKVNRLILTFFHMI
ncbi:MAG: type III secretion system export apparatus subunit SctT [Desulfovibrionaceae bacterium]|nr:type III secretion system export apparatus subunit SctT [Desulfovibrionaceae bacterium]